MISFYCENLVDFILGLQVERTCEYKLHEYKNSFSSDLFACDKNMPLIKIFLNLTICKWNYSDEEKIVLHLVGFP
jgi:hypothetical protein